MAYFTPQRRLGNYLEVMRNIREHNSQYSAQDMNLYIDVTKIPSFMYPVTLI